MKTEIVTLTTAILADKKDFPFGKKGMRSISQSVLQKWIREEHKYSIEIQCIFDDLWRAEIFKTSRQDEQPHYNPVGNWYFDGKTYEEALEKTLQEVLTKVI